MRRTYPQAASERLTIASDALTEVPCNDHKEDSSCEQQEEVSRSSKRLLPDRSHAAHNRANEKLVHFIVKQRMVEEHLLVGLIDLLYILDRCFSTMWFDRINQIACDANFSITLL